MKTKSQHTEFQVGDPVYLINSSHVKASYKVGGIFIKV